MLCKYFYIVAREEQNNTQAEAVTRNSIRLVDCRSGQKVDVIVDGKLYSSYLFTDTLPVLKKPVPYSIVSANGLTITCRCGLFAANPLGQKIFSKGKEELNFTLKPYESVTFRCSIEILNDKADKKQLDADYQKFIDYVK